MRYSRKSELWGEMAGCGRKGLQHFTPGLEMIAILYEGFSIYSRGVKQGRVPIAGLTVLSERLDYNENM